MSVGAIWPLQAFVLGVMAGMHAVALGSGIEPQWMLGKEWKQCKL